MAVRARNEPDLPVRSRLEARRARSPGPQRLPGTSPTTLRDPWTFGTWMLAVAATILRAIVVLVQPISLQNDSADYQRLAVSLATGHGFGRSHFALGGGPTALRPPLYPLFLGLFYKVFGVHLTAARLLGAVLGGITVLLLIVVTWFLWGRQIALVAGVLAAAFPPQVMAATSLMSEALALPLELAALLFVLHHRRYGRIWWAAAGGATLGLLVLTRPSLVVLALPLVFLLRDVAGSAREEEELVPPHSNRPTRKYGWRRWAPAAALLLSGTLVVTPWLIRDRLTMHSWVPVTTQNGYVLSGTYNATSAQDTSFPAAWRPANLDPTIHALLAAHPHADEVATDALLQAAADRYLRDHSGYLLRVGYWNSRRLVDLVPVAEVRAATASEYGLPGRWGTAEMVGGISLLVLALIGLALGAGRGLPRAYLVCPILLWISTVVMETIPRFRAVIDPFLIQLAAGALVAGWAILQRRRSTLASALTAPREVPDSEESAPFPDRQLPPGGCAPRAP